MLNQVTTVLAALLYPLLATSQPLPPAIRLEKDRKHYSISFPASDAAGWQALTAGVHAGSKWLHLADFPGCLWTGSSSGGAVRCGGAGPLASFELQVEQPADVPFAVLRASMRAARTCEIRGFRLLHPSSTGGMRTFQPAADWVLYADRFNALEIGTLAPAASVGQSVQGSWVSAITSARLRQTYAFSALSGRVWPTWLEWTPTESGLQVSVRAGGQTGVEPVRLKAGESFTSDPVLIGLWQKSRPQEALERIAAEFAKRNPRGLPPRRPEPGWCSWMYYAGRAGEVDVLRAADAAKSRVASGGYRLIQLDGGWWDRRGDWRPNERFPHGMAWLARQLHERGLLFGLHMSPFRIDPESKLAKEHPEWLLRKLDGSGFITDNGKRFVLDASHPDALRWLRDLFGRMAREWSVDYFKLDFLSFGAAEGLRHDPSSTGLAAYRGAVEAIREVVPKRVPILGCNMPSLSGQEFFDSVRVGPDINVVRLKYPGPGGEHAHMSWGPSHGRLEELGPGTQSLTGQARAVARQYYTHGRLYVNDADPVLVTPAYTLEEARAHFTLVALTGGSLFLGDRLDTLPTDRVALVTHPGMLDIWREGRHAEPVDLFSGGELPRIWKLLRKSGAVVVAMFNWSESEREARLPAAEFGFGRTAPLRLRDVWSGQPVRSQGGEIVWRQPAHSVTVIEAGR